MVEVKSLRDFSEMHFRVSKKQIQRLLFARLQLQEQLQELVEFQLAFVQGHEIKMIAVEDYIF